MLSPVETVKIFKSQPEQTLATGEIIFRNGDKGDVMYGIIEGEVEMLVDGQVIEILKTGDIFGQGALVHQDHLRTSTAVAKTDSTLACLNRQQFLFAVEQTPMFALEVMRNYSDRYRRLKRLIDGIGAI